MWNPIQVDGRSLVILQAAGGILRSYAIIESGRLSYDGTRLTLAGEAGERAVTESELQCLQPVSEQNLIPACRGFDFFLLKGATREPRADAAGQARGSPETAEAPAIGSEAFRWLDAHMAEALECPDEAFDRVFMLREEDWPRLEAAWERRPPAWREGCAYVLGAGPVAPSQRLLRLALTDPDSGVATQAACSLCAQMLEHPDEAPFDPAILPRLREFHRAYPHAKVEEVDELLRRHPGAE